MEIDEVKDLCIRVAEHLRGSPVEAEIQAIIKDLEWAGRKVYVRKPAGKERVETVAARVQKLANCLEEGHGWNDSVREAFEELDESVRRLRIEIARDTQTAT